MSISNDDIRSEWEPGDQLVVKLEGDGDGTDGDGDGADDGDTDGADTGSDADGADSTPE